MWGTLSDTMKMVWVTNYPIKPCRHYCLLLAGALCKNSLARPKICPPPWCLQRASGNRRWQPTRQKINDCRCGECI